METEVVIPDVEITNDGFTLLRYKDRGGFTHVSFDNLGLERVIEIFTQACRKEDIAPLRAGTGRRLVKLDVDMDSFLKEELGF
jgi:hypothetical protein